MKLVAPAHLALDTLFLDFVKGVRMFPYLRMDSITLEEIMPDYCMPKTRARCRLFNSFWAATDDLNRIPFPHVRYDCNCSKPYSLMCQSTSKVVCTYWLDQVQLYFTSQQTYNPYPFNNITNFNLLIIRTPDNNADVIQCHSNPLAHLHSLLTHRAVKHNYAVRQIPGGFEVLITPPYGNEQLMHACQLLKDDLQDLPFRLKVICYPFCKIN